MGKGILGLMRNYRGTKEMGQISESGCLVLLGHKLQLITRINYPNLALISWVREDATSAHKVAYVVTILFSLGVVEFFLWQPIYMYLAIFSFGEKYSGTSNKSSRISASWWFPHFRLLCLWRLVLMLVTMIQRELTERAEEEQSITPVCHIDSLW